MKRLLILPSLVLVAGCGSPNYDHIQSSTEVVPTYQTRDAKWDARHTKAIVNAADRRNRWPRSQAEVVFGIECAKIRCLEPEHPTPGITQDTADE